MRYNENIKDYTKYIESIKREEEIQKRLQNQIDMMKSKISSTEFEVLNTPDETQKRRFSKLIEWYQEDIKKYSLDIKNSKIRQSSLKQSVCLHDFGVISNEYVGEDGKTYQSGFCLDCDAEFNDVLGPIFVHSFKMINIVSDFTFDDYKRELEELKRISDYENNSDYLIGEKIIEEIIRRASKEKKNNSK